MAKKSSDRRFDKRVTRLGHLYRTDPDAFSVAWEGYVRNWLVEIFSRVHTERTGEGDERLRIFGVLDLAQKLAHATGATSHVSKSLSLLEHECAKAVAGLTDHHLYQFDKDCTTRIREGGR